MRDTLDGALEHLEELTGLVRSAKSARAHGRHATADKKLDEAKRLTTHISEHIKAEEG